MTLRSPGTPCPGRHRLWVMVSSVTTRHVAAPAAETLCGWLIAGGGARSPVSSGMIYRPSRPPCETNAVVVCLVLFSASMSYAACFERRDLRRMARLHLDHPESRRLRTARPCLAGWNLHVDGSVVQRGSPRPARRGSNNERRLIAPAITPMESRERHSGAAIS